MIPAADLTISANGQYVTPSPYGRRAAGEDRGAFDPREEFADQAALPNSGFPVDGEDVRAPIADRAIEGVLEQLELRHASDERSGHLRVGLTVARRERAVRRDRIPKAT